MLIGIDFDNTLANYDLLCEEKALQILGEKPTKTMLAAQGVSNKTWLRDRLRERPGGERQWQIVQAELYGRRMIEAQPLPGAQAFLIACHNQQIPVVIISHKTRFAVADSDPVDLHQMASDWLQKQGFFVTNQTGLSAAQVHFAHSRGEKIARIGALGCSHFIDDLLELLTDPDFPPGVQRLLLSPEAAVRRQHSQLDSAQTPSDREMFALQIYANWQEILDAFFIHNTV